MRRKYTKTVRVFCQGAQCFIEHPGVGINDAVLMEQYELLELLVGICAEQLLASFLVAVARNQQMPALTADLTPKDGGANSGQ